MNIKKHPIGLLCGTFDPIHNGHLAIAEAALKELHLKQIQFIPNKQPPHRAAPIASAAHRLTMVKLATFANPQYVVNDIEMQRAGPSYTIDTLKIFHNLIPDQPLCLIIGEDAFAHFNEWLHWQDIIHYCHLVIVSRPDITFPNEEWLRDLITQHATKEVNDLSLYSSGKIYYIEHMHSPFNATEIRNKISQHIDTSDSLPREVLQYINQHRLYIKPSETP